MPCSVSISDEKPLHMRHDDRSAGEQLVQTCFNLRREAAPHATQDRLQAVVNNLTVSISDEKPLHMRRHWLSLVIKTVLGFNLRREAAPHATALMAAATGGVFQVSISDEKPLHMRLRTKQMIGYQFGSFNLRREAAPHATSGENNISELWLDLFQSQTRSRSTCDSLPLHPDALIFFVSISDEKPLHMRHRDENW